MRCVDLPTCPPYGGGEPLGFGDFCHDQSIVDAGEHRLYLVVGLDHVATTHDGLVNVMRIVVHRFLTLEGKHPNRTDDGKDLGLDSNSGIHVAANRRIGY